MELEMEDQNVEEVETIDTLDRDPSTEFPLRESRLYRTRFPGAVRQKAYRFDGVGGYYNKEWDLTEGSGREFNWYHVELPRGNQKLSVLAQYLIDVLCPPLKLQDILSLVTNGPFCGHVDGAFVFRVNSPGPGSSNFTLRIAARVTENSLITVSLGRVPRLGFSPTGQSLLSEIPSVESPSSRRKDEELENGGAIVIREHVLEFLLTMNHSEEADNPVPKTTANLVVHVIDTHMDHLQDIVTKLEMELDSVEIELDKGGFALKKQMLDDRRFPKMHLNIQRLLQVHFGDSCVFQHLLLQNCWMTEGYPKCTRIYNASYRYSQPVIAHGEQVFPRVKEKCTTKSWFASEDIVSLEELVGRLRRLKENVGFIANRVTAIQAGLDSWQAEQINRKLYYLSFLSIIFLPLSIITGVFGMNVGGVPWTEQKNPKLKDGFLNVMLICVITLFLVFLCFMFPTVYVYISSWRRRRALKRSWSLNRKSFLRRTMGVPERGGYLRI